MWDHIWNWVSQPYWHFVVTGFLIIVLVHLGTYAALRSKGKDDGVGSLVETLINALLLLLAGSLPGLFHGHHRQQAISGAVFFLVVILYHGWRLRRVTRAAGDGPRKVP